MLKQTALYEKHMDLNAKMVDFGGWNMPIQYKGIIEEHKNTRNHVSLFDVSHMGEFIVKGKDATIFLNYVSTNDVTKLFDGKAQYSALLYENGTFVDDIIIYKINDTEYQICVNASNIEKDFNWLQQHTKNYEVELKNISDKISLLAIQGPKAQDTIKKIVAFDISTIGYYEFKKTEIHNTMCIIGRMGYTGEDGFELFIPNDKAIFFWDLIMQKGSEYNIQAAGLGARDTLRLEMGFSLYGNDIDHTTTPVEAGLNWIVDYKKEFIGKNKLVEQKTNGVNKKMIAFRLTDKGIPRQHYKILNSDKRNIGEVSSGSFSPMENIGIGMAYVESQYAKINTPIFIDIRGNMIPAITIKIPFYTKK